MTTLEAFDKAHQKTYALFTKLLDPIIDFISKKL